MLLEKNKFDTERLKIHCLTVKITVRHEVRRKRTFNEYVVPGQSAHPSSRITGSLAIDSKQHGGVKTAFL